MALKEISQMFGLISDQWVNRRIEDTAVIVNIIDSTDKTINYISTNNYILISLGKSLAWASQVKC